MARGGGGRVVAGSAWACSTRIDPPSLACHADDVSDSEHRRFDHDRAEAAVRELLAAIGEDPDRDGLLATPGRVARMLAEVTIGLETDPADHLSTVFEAGHDEIVLVRDIDFSSMCEHHMLPFIGRAHVGYIPGPTGHVTGLSKIARLVDGYSKRLQVQERLTTEIATAIERTLEPRGVIVVLEAEHLCMSIRGVQKNGASTVTSAVRGQFRDDPRSRSEAMSLITSHLQR
jgi:GTP cyclohydrolase IA